MDDAIIKRFYRLYKMPMPEGILPMNIQEFGNSSVATVPTLFDLVRKENYGGHELKKRGFNPFCFRRSGDEYQCHYLQDLSLSV